MLIGDELDSRLPTFGESNYLLNQTSSVGWVAFSMLTSTRMCGRGLFTPDDTSLTKGRKHGRFEIREHTGNTPENLASQRTNTFAPWLGGVVHTAVGDSSPSLAV